MIGTLTNCQQDIMLGDTQQFVIQHLRLVWFEFVASKQDWRSASVPDEVPVFSELQPGRFPEPITPLRTLLE